MDDKVTHTEIAASKPMPDVDALLVRYLQDRDARCPACGYNLRGLNGTRCPECGRELRLTIGLTEPILRAWIALAVGVFGSAGIGTLFWALVVVKGSPGRMPFLAWAAFVYFLACPILIWPTLALRRRFLRFTSKRQWSIAIAAIALTLLWSATFVIYCD